MSIQFIFFHTLVRDHIECLNHNLGETRYASGDWVAPAAPCGLATGRLRAEAIRGKNGSPNVMTEPISGQAKIGTGAQNPSGLALYWPTFDREQTSESVRILSITFLAIVAIMSSPALLAINQPSTLLAPIALGTLVGLGAFIASALGQPRVGAYVLILGVWVFATLVGFAGMTRYGPSVGAYALVVLMSGLLIGRWAAGLLALASLGASLVILELRASGQIVSPFIYEGGIGGASMLAIAIGFCAVFAVVGRQLQWFKAKSSHMEQRADTVVNQAVDGIFTLNRQSYILDVNSAGLAMLDSGLSEIPTQRFISFIDQTQSSEYTKLFSDLKPGDLIVRERKIRLAGGGSLEAEIRVLGLPNERIQLILRDISRQREAEESQRKLLAALNESDTGLALFDHQQNLVHANPSFCGHLGFGGGLEPGTSAQAMAKRADEVELTNQLRKSLGMGLSFSGRARRTSIKSGKEIVTHITASSVPDPKEDAPSYIVTTRDVTREAHLEDEFQKSNQVHAVSELARSVAHDFNNLLTVIFANAEYLQENNPSEEIDEIFEASQRAGVITAKLRALSHDHAIHSRAIDLNQCLDEALGMLKSIVREDTQVEVEKRATSAWVENDPNQIQHILLNLVANARDAMPHGGRILLVTESLSIPEDNHRQSPSLPEGDYVAISIIDRGLGMPEPVIRKATEPFFTTKGDGRGTGLGLTSVRAIVEQSGGAMEIQSKLNRGTTVCIFLPEFHPISAKTDNHADKVPSRSSGGLRVLVAESDSQLRRLIRRQLEKWGHIVLTASDQPAAETIAETTPLDVLIADSRLPSAEGTALAYSLRARYPQLKIILMSRYAPDQPGAEEAVNADAVLLPKPFTMVDLKRSLGEILPPEQDESSD
ncbi:MAG: ATP-binding protein [Myxococcota bacterium]|nr:ATP-binding protein [Myxococcota bacterium]